MDKIRMHDGTEVDVIRCGYADRALWITVPQADLSFLDVAEFFADAGKTSEIVFITPVEQITYNGYTDLIMVNKDTVDNFYLIALKEGGQNED